MRAETLARAGLAGSSALGLAIAACAPQGDLAGADGRAARQPVNAIPPAGSPLPTGASIAAMSDQYSHARRGTTAATGASSWVAPAPPPAFVISTPLPPGDPPAPPPAAVANRQPEPRPAPQTPPPVSPPPAAAAPAAPAAPAASPDLTRGRQLFADYGCGGCHVLADAGGAGGVGPSLDSNPRLTRDYVAAAIGEGRGAMPAFRDLMTADEIATLAAYVVQAARK
jgi:mono/diheme cytochrome c family protein